MQSSPLLCIGHYIYKCETLDTVPQNNIQPVWFTLTTNAMLACTGNSSQQAGRHKPEHRLGRCLGLLMALFLWNSVSSIFYPSHGNFCIEE